MSGAAHAAGETPHAVLLGHHPGFAPERPRHAQAAPIAPYSRNRGRVQFLHDVDADTGVREGQGIPLGIPSLDFLFRFPVPSHTQLCLSSRFDTHSPPTSIQIPPSQRFIFSKSLLYPTPIQPLAWLTDLTFLPGS